MIRLFYVATIGVAACGLVSTDLVVYRLHFPPKDFTVDAGDWGLAGSAKVPKIACDMDCTSICSGDGCTASCGGVFCQADLQISLLRDYNLSTEASGYADIVDQSIVSVTVDDIFFQIDMNTLNVETPELTVILGPQTITKAGDPGAQVVGTIPPIAAGQTGRVDVTFSPSGQATLKSFMDHFHTPFRVIVSGTKTVHADDALPAGKLVGKVQADAHVSL